jgi:hypothetical protein
MSGTPCERMHFAAASWDCAKLEGLPVPPLLALVLLDLLDPPQPDSASAELKPMTRMRTHRRRRCSRMLATPRDLCCGLLIIVAGTGWLGSSAPVGPSSFVVGAP